MLIDLKIGKLTHQDIGQMQMYVNYYDDRLKLPEEKQTIRIILCKEDSTALIEFKWFFIRTVSYIHFLRPSSMHLAEK